MKRKFTLLLLTLYLLSTVLSLASCAGFENASETKPTELPTNAPSTTIPTEASNASTSDATTSTDAPRDETSSVGMSTDTSRDEMPSVDTSTDEPRDETSSVGMSTNAPTDEAPSVGMSTDMPTATNTDVPTWEIPTVEIPTIEELVLPSDSKLILSTTEAITDKDCETVMVKASDVYTGSLILVNPLHALKTDPGTIEGSLVKVYDLRAESEGPHKFHLANARITLQKETYDAFEDFVVDANKKNAKCVNILLAEGYRSSQQQEDRFLAAEGVNVLPPNHSDFQTGYSLRLHYYDGEFTYALSSPMEDVKIVASIIAESIDYYGFIQRYPAGKSTYTGMSDEAMPYLYRYVGMPHARIITEGGYCLEEYIEVIKNYGESNPLRIQDSEKSYLVFYVPAADEGEHTSFQVPKGCDYVWSGNNVDGFIVTVYLPEDTTTDEPTDEVPTDQPTVAPTEEPSVSEPTVAPTEEPSVSEPTVAPTEEPSVSEPTVAPTEEPSASEPTVAPTEEPSVSEPTVAPTEEPSASEPTVAPTEEPSVSEPTVVPTEEPSASEPTVAPTEEPSASEPTVAPTEEPSVSEPTDASTDEPTDTPTVDISQYENPVLFHTPVLDGVLDDAYLQSYHFENPQYTEIIKGLVDEKGNPIVNAHSNRSHTYLLWDGDYIYVAIERFDNDLIQRSEAYLTYENEKGDLNPWYHDTAEVWYTFEQTYPTKTSDLCKVGYDAFGIGPAPFTAVSEGTYPYYFSQCEVAVTVTENAAPDDERGLVHKSVVEYKIPAKTRDGKSLTVEDFIFVAIEIDDLAYATDDELRAKGYDPKNFTPNEIASDISSGYTCTWTRARTVLPKEGDNGGYAKATLTEIRPDLD